MKRFFTLLLVAGVLMCCFGCTAQMAKADLEDAKLETIVSQRLGVPDKPDIDCQIGEKYYWDAGEVYLRNVAFYENGKLVAGAGVDPATGNLTKDIYMYE